MNHAEPRVCRTYLYVPGDSGRRLREAHTRGADAVIADLEDAVAEGHKAAALQDVEEWLRDTDQRTERWVRVNPGERGLREIARLAACSPTGFCLPKVASAEDVHRAADVVADASTGGHPAPRLMPLIESARGLLSAAAIAAADGVSRLQLGELDLGADLGLAPDETETELLALRTAVVVASAAAGLPAPVGPVSPQYRDQPALKASTQRLRRLGFIGRAVIHPAQVATVHRVFAPSPDDVARARAVVADYELAQSRGAGVLVGEDGRMVDEAVVRRSRQTLALVAAQEDSR